MGYYVQGPNHGKVRHIQDNMQGKVVSREEAALHIDAPDLAVVVVVNNGPFDAAAFAYSEDEFKEFTRPDDRRPKTFMLADRNSVETASGY